MDAWPCFLLSLSTSKYSQVPIFENEEKFVTVETISGKKTFFHRGISTHGKGDLSYLCKDIYDYRVYIFHLHMIFKSSLYPS